MEELVTVIIPVYKVENIASVVNLFTNHQLSCQSIERAKRFVGKFKDISYDNTFDCFKFSFNYSD